MRGTTEYVEVNPVQFRVRVRTEVTLGQDQNARRPVRLKLMKSSTYDCKSALFSDSIHNSLEMINTRYPNAIDVTHQVLHMYLGVADFICN